MGALPKSLPRPRLPEGWPRMPHMPRFISSRGGSRRGLPPWRIVRRWLILASLALLILASAYMLWFRDSSYVKVEDVKITGTEMAPDVDSALRAAAEGQSTLNPDADALRQAVAGNPLVAGIKVDTDFPHTMLIDVQVREPVAYLGSEGVVIAGDGTVLDNTGKAPDGVPEMSLDKQDGSVLAGDAVTGDALEVARVLGVVPGPLAAVINSASMSKDHGVTVDVGPGLELRFGDSSSAELKWKAAAAVLADPKFEGATYLDLSVPDRPVAGGYDATTDAADDAEDAVTAADPAVTATTDPTLIADPAVAATVP
jgi:cell division septal protein FtsQ